MIHNSYTFGTYPYGWSGIASVGGFYRLTTLSHNVHAANSDPTNDTYSAKYINRAGSGNRFGGNAGKQSLIGLYVTAPYLHDGGVTASSEALRQASDASLLWLYLSAFAMLFGI